jgi:HNH endonuclease
VIATRCIKTPKSAADQFEGAVEVRVGGGRTLIDATDMNLISGYSWYIQTDLDDRSYVRANVFFEGRKRTVLLHRLLLGLGFGNPLQVDHRDGDGLHNRRENLRRATRLENARYRVRNTNRLGFKGVMWDGWAFRGRFYIDSKRICSQAFGTAREAAEWYDRMALQYYGEFAAINHSAGEPAQDNRNG